MLRAGGMSGVALADMTVGLPVADASLDGIWCAAALLHVPRPLVPATITGFAAALRPAGRLHLSVSEGTGEGFERDSYIAAGDRWFVHHEEAPLVELLARSGLVVVNLRRSKSRRRWLTLDAVRREGRGD
jgi:hypothetical protein